MIQDGERWVELLRHRLEGQELVNSAEVRTISDTHAILTAWLTTGSLVEGAGPIHATPPPDSAVGWEVALYIDGDSRLPASATTTADDLTAESISRAVDALARLSLAERIRQEGVDRGLLLE